MSRIPHHAQLPPTPGRHFTQVLPVGGSCICDHSSMFAPWRSSPSAPAIAAASSARWNGTGCTAGCHTHLVGAHRRTRPDGRPGPHLHELRPSAETAVRLDRNRCQSAAEDGLQTSIEIPMATESSRDRSGVGSSRLLWLVRRWPRPTSSTRYMRYSKNIGNTPGSS